MGSTGAGGGGGDYGGGSGWTDVLVDANNRSGDANNEGGGGGGSFSAGLGGTFFSAFLSDVPTQNGDGFIRIEFLSAPPPPGAVPVPAALALFGVGLLGLFGARARSSPSRA